MKTKTTLLFLLILYGNYSYSQPYKSVFGKDTTQWNVIYTIPDYFPTYIYKAFGDTSINSQNYRFLYKGNKWTLGDRYGYLREDTLEGKLWFLSLNFQEKLIMDLSLSKSDTFIFETNFEYSVDSVFYISGRKNISFNGDNEDSISFIEGIGPFNLFYFAESQTPSKAQIRCMFKDNMLVYKNSLYNECTDTVTGIKNTIINAPNIFPNPTNNSVLFTTNENGEFIIEFYNASGFLLQKNQVQNNEIIDINKFPAGIYVIRIISKYRNYSSKLIKM